MRANKYSYIIDLDANISAVFNGITKNFIVIDNKTVPSYEAIISSPNQYLDSHPKIINELQHIGIVVDDNFDELETIKSERKSYIECSVYKTSIIPTFECNYNCWYCTQHHQETIIEYDKLKLIIRHIKKYLIDNNITEYILSWFGGEPLTKPEIISWMSSELKKFCHEHNIAFSGAITTNGALLTSGIINMLKANMIDYFQIAIDGDKSSHNKNKYDDTNKSSFDLILNNLVNLAIKHPNANITLRLNHTPLNIEDTHLVDEISALIPYNIRNKITVDLQHIWQIDERKYDIEKLKSLQLKFVDSGFQLSTSHIFSMCYVDKKHFNTIYYNGGVEKCDDRTMDTLRGYITDNGDIIWQEKPLFPTYDILSDNSPCSQCNYYPICYGGCPIKRDESIAKNGNFICGFQGDFSKLAHRIQDYCWRTLNNKRIQYKS